MGLRKLLKGLLSGTSIALGVAGLLVFVWLGIRCFCLPSEALAIGLSLSAGAILTGHLIRFKPGYRTGYAAMILALLSLVVLPFRPSGGGAASNPASVIGSLRTINTAEITYASTYRNGYSPSLSTLGPPLKGTGPSAAAAALIDSTLAGAGNTSEKSGYRFVYSPGPRNTQGQIVSYSITASPMQLGVTGSNYYYTDQTGVIRCNTTGTASGTDSPIAG